MKLRFIKVARYNPESVGKNRYDGYCQITSGIADPSIVSPHGYEEAFIRESFDVVISSPLRRALESANYLSATVHILHELQEVRFSLEDLVTEAEFEKFGSNLVRQKFVQAFVADTLLDRREKIFKDLKKILSSLDGDSVLVSHSFKMKIMETYLREGDSLVDHPGLLGKYIYAEQKTYPLVVGLRWMLQF